MRQRRKRRGLIEGCEEFCLLSTGYIPEHAAQTAEMETETNGSFDAKSDQEILTDGFMKAMINDM